MGGGRLLDGQIWLHGDFLSDIRQCEQLFAWMEATPWARDLHVMVDTTPEDDVIDVEACESTDPVALIEQTGT